MRLNNYANIDKFFNTPRYYLTRKKGESVLHWLKKNLGRVNFKQAQTLGDNYVYSFHFNKSEDLAWFVLTFGEELDSISKNSNIQHILNELDNINFIKGRERPKTKFDESLNQC